MGRAPCPWRPGRPRQGCGHGAWRWTSPQGWRATPWSWCTPSHGWWGPRRPGRAPTAPRPARGGRTKHPPGTQGGVRVLQHTRGLQARVGVHVQAHPWLHALRLPQGQGRRPAALSQPQRVCVQDGSADAASCQPRSVSVWVRVDGRKGRREDTGLASAGSSILWPWKRALNQARQ